MYVSLLQQYCSVSFLLSFFEFHFRVFHGKLWANVLIIYMLQFALLHVNQIRVNQSECKRLCLLLCGFNTGKIHTYIYIRSHLSSILIQAANIEFTLDRDTIRCVTLLHAITSDLTRLIFRIVLINEKLAGCANS